MATNNYLSLMVTALAAGLLGCNQKVEFSELLSDSVIPVAKTSEKEIASSQMKFSSTGLNVAQDQWDDNRTSLSFQVLDSNNETINDLLGVDFIVNENGTDFSEFQLKSNSQQFVQTVDIVIALDVTGSMAPTIESAKSRVINFIRNSRASGYHTRMCLVTFGDYTVQKCDRFYDNDPAKPETLAQVDELISEVTKLRALVGAEDPGGRTFAENPLSAVIDSSIAPWAPNGQRFMILITDARFLYSPSNQGEIGAKAPFYADALNALAASQMNLFLVAPTAAGYNSTFLGAPSLVTASQGEYFAFDDLVNGRITLDTVLSRIIQRVRTTYNLNFVADLISGLNPGLPMAERNIKIRLKQNPTAQVRIINANSNLPDGRPNIKMKWKLSDKEIDLSSLVVKINGLTVTSGFKIVNGELVFQKAPAMGAKIEVSYQFAKIKDSLLFQPMVLGADTDLNGLMIKFNGVKATKKDVQIESTIEGHWTVRPADHVLSEEDPFEIRKNGGLNIQIFRVAAE